MYLFFPDCIAFRCAFLKQMFKIVVSKTGEELVKLEKGKAAG